MALIEIPNIGNSDMTVRAVGRGRLAVVGEPVVAVDLINTVAAPGSAVADDLLSADRGAEAWWRIEKARVPTGDVPDIIAVNPRRSWCAPGICGNRVRVARHHRRAGRV
jgi:hypothetical protein